MVRTCASWAPRNCGLAEGPVDETKIPCETCKPCRRWKKAKHPLGSRRRLIELSDVFLAMRKEIKLGQRRGKSAPVLPCGCSRASNQKTCSCDNFSSVGSGCFAPPLCDMVDEVEVVVVDFPIRGVMLLESSPSELEFQTNNPCDSTCEVDHDKDWARMVLDFLNCI